MIRIVEGSVSDKWQQVQILLREHVDELATHKHLMVLNPDVDRYEAMEEAGVLFALFAYDGDDIVGYSVNFVARNLHYSDLVYAQNDVLFVRQTHRNGRLGLQLIHETERVAKRHGARFIVWHAKPNTALNDLLPRLGYGVQDIMHSKEL